MPSIIVDGVNLGAIKLNKGVKLESVVRALKKKINDNKKLVKKVKVEKRSKYIGLKEIIESKDKKNIVFSFNNNTEFYYNLLSKKLSNLEGGFNKVELIEGSPLGDLIDEGPFYKIIIENSKVVWIKKFFELCRETNSYRRPPVFLASKIISTKLEILSKMEIIQKTQDVTNIIDFVLPNRKFKTKLEDTGLDSWFIENANNNNILWEFVKEYTNSKDSGVVEEFRYFWTNYQFPYYLDFLKKSKSLIDKGYDLKRLVEYLTKDVVHQGLKPLIEQRVHDQCDLEDLGCTYDEVEDYRDVIEGPMNIEYSLWTFNLLKRYVELQDDKNYDKYPKNLKTAKDISLAKMINKKSTVLEQEYKKTINELKKFEFSQERYSVIAPDDIIHIMNEGNSLHHCVGNYAKDVALGRCKILFLRNKENIKKPLLTLQITGKEKYRVSNAFGNNNRKPNFDEESFLKVYRKYLSSLK